MSQGLSKATSPNRPASESPVASLTEAEWYDLSIDWNARIRREIPLLMEVFGPPGAGGGGGAGRGRGSGTGGVSGVGEVSGTGGGSGRVSGVGGGSGAGGVIDAGCGSGHQVAALCKAGYRVVGVDLNEEMLAVARAVASAEGVSPKFVHAAYAELVSRVGGGFDAVYCLANSLAASGSRDAVREAVGEFGKCLRAGGRMFVQVLNFPPMRREVPCVKGPRVTKVGGVEYISVRNFAFEPDAALVSNITMWNDGGWKCHAQGRKLYPVTLEELRGFCGESSLRIDHVWGGYGKEPFDAERSVDLIIAATRV